MSAIEIWKPISLEELALLFANSNRPYWISGGWAIDLFLGKKTRPHEDLDISIARTDLTSFQEILKDWELQVVDPPNSKNLRPLKTGERLEPPYYNIWSRKKIDGPWNLQIMLCDLEESEWVYRRNKSIRGPLAEFGWKTPDGKNVLSPVIQLLYKSRSPREKDIQDLENCLLAFTPRQRDRLRELILLDSGEYHPWISMI